MSTEPHGRDETATTAGGGTLITLWIIGFIVATLLGSIGLNVAVSTLNYGHSASWYTAAHHLPISYSVISEAGLWAGMLGTAYVLARTRPYLRLRMRISLGRADVKYFLAGLLMQLLITVAYIPFNVHTLSAPVHRLVDGEGLIGRIVIFAVVVLGAPIVEEYFFRGVLLVGLERFTEARTRVPAQLRGSTAVVISGLVFAGAHFESVQFAGLALVGVVFSIIASRTGRLGPSMMAHAGFNAAGAVVMFTWAWQ